MNNFNYCPICGHTIEYKEVPLEGKVEFCPSCNKLYFDRYNSAVSTIILNEQRDKVLLIRQYDMPDYILCAGYINRGECAEQTSIREAREELNIDIKILELNKTAFYMKSSTLMINLIATTTFNSIVKFSYPEVQDASWVSFSKALEILKPNSLAKEFFDFFLKNKVQNLSLK